MTSPGFIPTTRANQTRGVTENEFGSEVPNTTPIKSDIPLGLSIQSMEGVDRETGRAYNVERITALVDPRLDVKIEDRFTDQYSGEIYKVIAVRCSNPQGPFLTFPQELGLVRFTA